MFIVMDLVLKNTKDWNSKNPKIEFEPDWSVRRLGQFNDALINCVIYLTEFETCEEVAVVYFIVIVETAVEIHGGIISLVSSSLTPSLPFLYPFRTIISFKNTSKSCLMVAALVT
jgi:hypothetical protein